MTQNIFSTFYQLFVYNFLQNSHAIEVEVGHPAEVDEIFDNISYNKGASVIRMLHNFIGNEAFKQGTEIFREINFRVKLGKLVLRNFWEAISATSFYVKSILEDFYSMQDCHLDNFEVSLI